MRSFLPIVRTNDIFTEINTLIVDMITRFRPVTTTIAIAAGLSILAMALISKRQRTEVKEELLNILLIVLAIAGLASAIGWFAITGYSAF